ncbi:MAG: UDP binding domain-containing protein, partial [Pyrinomonadaceae bacterium]
LLNRHKRAVAASNIVFFGVAYKADIGDIRESAALQVMKALYSAGANVSYWDPVRAGHSSVKSGPKLEFTKHERAALPLEAANNLKAHGEVFIYEPVELGKTWSDVRNQVLNDDVNCIVLAAAHTEFRDTYADILSTERRPAIADLCNAIEPWLRDKKENPDPGDPGAADRYRYTLAANDDYALLGVTQTELSQLEAQPIDVILR